MSRDVIKSVHNEIGTKWPTTGRKRGFDEEEGR